MRTTVEQVIRTRGLTKSFGSTRALDGVDLTVGRGEVHGFLGPNGSGKSTTIRVLLGLLRKDGGEATLLGGDPWRDAVALHRRLAYVPGDVNLWPNLSGGEAIDLLGELRGSQDTARREELVERFQLDPTKRCSAYSKGNRQKVAIVAGLAADVEQEELDVGGQSRDDRDLLPVALGVGGTPLGRVELEPLDELLAPGRVLRAAQLAQQVDRLPAGQVRPQVHVAGDVGEPPVQRDGVPPWVATEESRLAAVLAQQAEQHPDGRGLAGAVGPEEPVHLAAADRQVNAVESPGAAEGLGETARPDDLLHGRPHSLRRRLKVSIS